MKKIEYKTNVFLNINDEYRIEINGQKNEYEQFTKRSSFVKYLKENYRSAYSRLNDQKTRTMYKGDWDAFIVITSGQWAGSFAMVNTLESIMSRYDSSKKRNAWTITKGNKANDVEGFSPFDKQKWTINKDYEKFTKKVVSGSVNHFYSAKKIHGDQAMPRLASLLALYSDEEIEQLLHMRNEVLERKEMNKASKNNSNVSSIDIDEFNNILEMYDNPEVEVSVESTVSVVSEVSTESEVSEVSVESEVSEVSTVSEASEVSEVSTESNDRRDLCKMFCDHFEIEHHIVANVLKRVQYSMEQDKFYKQAVPQIQVSKFNCVSDWLNSIQERRNEIAREYYKDFDWDSIDLAA
ncbi:hypothetical protein WN238_001471 [Vibrio parahaemolyticus]